LIGISSAYLLNTIELTNIDEVDYKAQAIHNAKKSIDFMNQYIEEQKKEIDFVLPSLYNVACIFAILYRFEKNNDLSNEFITKATSYLQNVYDKNLVRRDYILNDPDWRHIVDPERFDISEEVKEKLVKVIGQFFKKKYSRFEIAKLYMRIYESLTKDDFDNELFKKKAIERLKRSFDSGLVSMNQVQHSAFQYSAEFFEFVPNEENGEFEMIDKVNKNHKDKHGNVVKVKEEVDLD
ncbi:MAG: hypothetical protein K8I03_07665, partial [Ignavibacteria bacterium]|nr:hypothetical protein [Ignavibacteria bacterium]